MQDLKQGASPGPHSAARPTSPFSLFAGLHSVLRPWRRYAFLLTAIFISQSAFLLSVLPPFEGWDEYQHLAYIAFLSEQGRPAVLGGGDFVPRDLYAGLIRFPHARHCVEQLGRHGARQYAEFWSHPPPSEPLPGAPDVPLYQAQHSSFYYRLCVPVYRWLWDPADPLPVVTALRWMNVAFGAVAIGVVLWALGRLMPDGPPRRLIGLLVCLQPLFILNCARIANDALAVMLATVVIGLVLTLTERHLAWKALIIGAAMGGAVLAKITNLALLPLVPAAAGMLLWRRRASPARAAAFAVVAVGVAGAVTFPYFRFNLAHFGRLTPMQEAVQNEKSGVTWERTRHAVVAEINWWDEFDRRYTRHALWVGGWSFLRTGDEWMRAHMHLIRLSALGFLLAMALRSRRRDGLFNHGDSLWLLLATCGLYAVGLAYHMLQSRIALGHIGTNIWYAAATFPWLICLFAQGAAYLSRRWALPIMALMMAVVYMAAQVQGTLFEMMRCYTGHSWDAVARERMAALHLPGLGPAITAPAMILGMLLAAWAALAAIACPSEEGAKSPSE